MVRTGRVRRAKLYYLRGLKGKAARLRERDLTSALVAVCMPTSRHERALRRAGFRAIAGVDEAGRGALFGPVFAAAVVLDPERPIRGLDDSKRLEPERREVLAATHPGARPSLGRGRRRRLRDRPLEYPRSRAAGHAPRRGADLPGRCDHLLIDAITDRRSASANSSDSWGCTVFLDRRRFHSGQGRARPRCWRPGIRCFPSTDLGAKQRLWDTAITWRRWSGSAPPPCTVSVSSRCGIAAVLRFGLVIRFRIGRFHCSKASFLHESDPRTFASGDSEGVAEAAASKYPWLCSLLRSASSWRSFLGRNTGTPTIFKPLSPVSAMSGTSPRSAASLPVWGW